MPYFSQNQNTPPFHVLDTEVTQKSFYTCPITNILEKTMALVYYNIEECQFAFYTHFPFLYLNQHGFKCLRHSLQNKCYFRPEVADIFITLQSVIWKQITALMIILIKQKTFLKLGGGGFHNIHYIHNHISFFNLQSAGIYFCF